jgi:uncharacterized protein
MSGTYQGFRGAIGYTTPARNIPRAITRSRVLNWIRVTHLWLGLWGAMLGLAFGVTGFLMNHRTLLRIPVERAQTMRAQVAIPAAFANPDELTTWLRGRFALPKARALMRNESSTRVRFRGQELEQAERWSVTLATPKFSVSARHVPGSGLIDLETQDASGWGLLMRLHTGDGASVIWVLIADTIAGALVLLTLSGVLLWTRLRLPRLAGAAVLLIAPVLTAVYLATI